MMKKYLLISVCALLLTAISATYALCVVYDFSRDRKLYLTGQVEQTMRYGLQNDTETLAGGGSAGGAYRGLSEAYYAVFFEQQYVHNEMFEFRSGLRLQGDWAYNINDGSERWGDTGQGLGQSEQFMKRHSHNAQRDVLREFNVGISTRHFNARLGKQTVVWGETDLLRLMDMFNPLDLQRQFPGRDADYGYNEILIPLWAVKVGVTPDVSVGPLSDIQLELAWTPEIRQTLFNIGPRSGGVWGFPVPHNMPDLSWAFGAPPGFVTFQDLDLGPDNDHGGRAQTLSNSTYDFRVRSNWGNTYMTLNGFYGWDDMPIIQERPGVTGFAALYPSFGGNIDDSAVAGVPGYGIMLDQKLYRKQAVGFTLAREMDFLGSFVKAVGQPANPTMRIESYYQFKKHIPTNWFENVKKGSRMVQAAGGLGTKPGGAPYTINDVLTPGGIGAG
ncbi:MAG: hypothetical protein Q7J12_02715, partial [Syntrophales bacterium]|nr:hypothetical protein [Syntrophales bacterium]